MLCKFRGHSCSRRIAKFSGATVSVRKQRRSACRMWIRFGGNARICSTTSSLVPRVDMHRRGAT
ncbi:hypothetical protein WS83_30265 [Burkholderia sp. MSMB2042]|uniref:Uncharacterized protein n=1 Tax=Burkholderia savannae TaxID=1637837 RepID=A0ABR5T8Y6_9BURK|nr:hypothetical protein WS78_24340 [Burkholderia savannae]KVG49607.1 hypothetical protein WS77_25275 [Burkholderia sp. MSMB0265]KVG83014.1 hypothetical protein WS81_09010 [Burkholderia sp. MSMB2040]KVG93398.1 hypothetical protein WS82_09290 [Burkholderia sp. MSMB2041]KVG97825.1 hypothetical protein WS83_30265 [Burkholderia sp. MSMB2042]KVK83532.1 hypothetical protein WS91_06190 [Burkholderia sp. MSMB1498]